MFFLILIALIVIVIIIFGGRLENLLSCKFKHAWMVFIALGFKIISITSLYQTVGISGDIIPYFRVLSLLLVVLFIIVNISFKGMPLVALGLICNTMVIMFNNGNMPVNADFAHLIATGKELEALKSGLPVNSFILTSSYTKLAFLGDIFLMPQWIPLTRLFSIGDVLITIGAVIFVAYYMRFNNEAVFKHLIRY